MTTLKNTIIKYKSYNAIYRAVIFKDSDRRRWNVKIFDHKIYSSDDVDLVGTLIIHQTTTTKKDAIFEADTYCEISKMAEKIA